MRKPHLVIICGVLYPNPSATGLCAYRYASLLAVDYNIEFIALSSNGKEENDKYEGFPVHTLSCTRWSLENKTKGLVKRMIHLIGSSQLKLRILGNLGWYAKAAYKKLEEIQSSNRIDAVLTVCSPFPAHIAGVEFKQKHPEVRLCAYTVDPYAAKGRIIPFFRSFRDLVALEDAVCKRFDCLFLSEEAINSRQDIYGDIPNKLALPYLLPKAQSLSESKFDKKIIHCVYAGSFYRDIRNPEFMLKVFSEIKDGSIILHLYSAGCDDLVKKYADNSHAIDSRGYVSHEELKQVYASCDFLIGVSNATNDFLPSKTYEYLSMRRPIVFFNPKGYENEVLSKYPHSLQLSDDTPLETAIQTLQVFIAQERGKTISKSELNEIYSTNTDSYVRSILLKGLKKTD